MVYTMKVYIDGGCRGNGQYGACGAAAAVFESRFGRTETWTRYLSDDSDYPPTNQRAEMTAVILALKKVLEKFDELDTRPRLKVEILTDSKYVVGCMTEWVYKWCKNGWVNARGADVANKDLIEEASDLDDQVAELGEVVYKWIPRKKNYLADEACDERMDEEC